MISVLPWFSKILEKFMYKRGIKFLDKHNIIGGSLGIDHGYVVRSVV